LKRLRERMGAAGRLAAPHPKKADRPRYPGGRLKPPTPNPRVVAERRLLLNAPEAHGAALRHAENALDLMLARGWLTQPLHEAATSFRRLYRAAFPPLPDLKTVSIAEEPTRDPDIRDIRVQVSSPNPDGNPAAMDSLRSIWRVLALQPAARSEVIELCLLHGSWPTWLVGMVERRRLSADEQLARRAFYWGLHNINAVLAHHPPAPALAA
jgi:hypothetical protein